MLTRLWEKGYGAGTENGGLFSMATSQQIQKGFRAQESSSEGTEKHHVKGCPQRLGNETAFFAPRGRGLHRRLELEEKMLCGTCQWPINDSGERLGNEECEREAEREREREEEEGWKKRPKMGG